MRRNACHDTLVQTLGNTTALSLSLTLSLSYSLSLSHSLIPGMLVTFDWMADATTGSHHRAGSCSSGSVRSHPRYQVGGSRPSGTARGCRMTGGASARNASPVSDQKILRVVFATHRFSFVVVSKVSEVSKESKVRKVHEVRMRSSKQVSQ